MVADSEKAWISFDLLKFDKRGVGELYHAETGLVGSVGRSG